MFKMPQILVTSKKEQRTGDEKVLIKSLNKLQVSRDKGQAKHA